MPPVTVAIISLAHNLQSLIAVMYYIVFFFSFSYTYILYIYKTTRQHYSVFYIAALCAVYEKYDMDKCT